jgi:aspartyl aminopeptidase
MTRITEAITSRSFDSDAHAKVLRNSYVVSADMAHALHPNYESRHDPALSPKFHGGLVIKHNVRNRCRVSSLSTAI